MAVKFSSVIKQSGKPDWTETGYLPKASASLGVLVGGKPVTQSADATGAGTYFQYFDGSAVVSTTNPFPLGLLAEASFNGFPQGGPTGAGSAGDLWNNNRTAAYSVHNVPGNIYDVYDDGSNLTPVTVNGVSQNSSCPFVANLTYVIGNAIFATTPTVGLGYLTNVASGAGSALLGYVVAVTSAGYASPILSIRWLPALMY
jgi:hypothetical protein